MKTGLIITGGHVDLAFAGNFLREFEIGPPADPAAGNMPKPDAAATGNVSEAVAAAGSVPEADPETTGNVSETGAAVGNVLPADPETTGNLSEAGAAGASRRPRIHQVIAVDAGLAVTKELGLTPQAIVGDFDTVDPAVLALYRNNPEILWDVHKPEKDETDTELAINTALKLGCGRLYILGATGGRLDHELSNIHLLKLCLDHGAEAFICDANNRICLLSRGKVFERGKTYGRYISFIPLSQKVTGITLTGFKYPLSDRTIEIGVDAGLCVSNEIAADRAEIRFRDGLLICIESRD